MLKVDGLVEDVVHMRSDEPSSLFNLLVEVALIAVRRILMRQESVECSQACEWSSPWKRSRWEVHDL